MEKIGVQEIKELFAGLGQMMDLIMLRLKVLESQCASGLVNLVGGGGAEGCDIGEGFWRACSFPNGWERYKRASQVKGTPIKKRKLVFCRKSPPPSKWGVTWDVLAEWRSSVLYMGQSFDNQSLFAGSTWCGQFPGAEMSCCRQGLATSFYLTPRFCC